ncbi:MAG: hypothetical protein ABIQ39_03695, partial [Ilumatobacteraceae bacterium]
MTDWNDTDDVFYRFVSDEQADDLVAGRSNLESEAGLAQVAGLFAALREPGRPAELAGTDDLIAQLTATVRDHEIHPYTSARSRPMIAKVFTAKVAVIAAASVFAVAGAAAATGNLPGVGQSHRPDAFTSRSQPHSGEHDTSTSVESTSAATSTSADETTSSDVATTATEDS